MKTQTLSKWLLASCLMLLVFFQSCKKEVLIEEPTQQEIENQIQLSPDMSQAEFDHVLALLHPDPGTHSSEYPTIQAAWIDRQYTVAYQNYAVITIGGVAYNRSIDEWLAGSTAGTVYISPEDFAQLLAGATQHVRMEIGNNPYPWWPTFPLRTLRMTMLDKGNFVMNGTYDTNWNYLQFIGVGPYGSGNLGGTECGAFTSGSITGNFSSNHSSFTGTTAYGFVAGCFPVIISASVNFYFTGTQI